MTVKTISGLILVMLLWAICFPLITIGITYAPHMTFAALRALLAGVALVVIAVALRRPFPHGLSTWLQIVLIGCGATTLGFFGMFHAAEFVAPGIATVIANTQPLFAAALAVVFLRERLGTLARLGLAIGFVGTIAIAGPRLFGPSDQSFALGLAYVVVSVAGITFSNLLIRRLAGKVDEIYAMGFQMLIGALPLGAMAAAFERPDTIEWTSTFLIVLVLLSVAGTGLAYWLWCAILQRTGLARANAFSFLVPVFGLIIGVLWFDERVGGAEFLGILMTLVGVALVMRRVP